LGPAAISSRIRRKHPPVERSKATRVVDDRGRGGNARQTVRGLEGLRGRKNLSAMNATIPNLWTIEELHVED